MALKNVFVGGGGISHAVPPIPLKPGTIQSEARGRPAAARILLEALVVMFVGVVLAFAANQISPRGLALTRNYFPAGSGPPTAPSAGAGSRRDASNSPAISLVEVLAARLKEQGLQVVGSGEAVKLFHDPRFQQGRIVFIDARDEPHYQAGHLPGAYEFDPYHPEKYFPTALPPCQAAEQVVVYCHGGDCDDSESAALTLRDVGIATHKLFVYAGGITEWITNGWPVEIGERNSGKLRNPDQ
ncbi:MAG: rhodanese-like domain-containing protein [Verrucomicrobiia bacterium]